MFYKTPAPIQCQSCPCSTSPSSFSSDSVHHSCKSFLRAKHTKTNTEQHSLSKSFCINSWCTAHFRKKSRNMSVFEKLPSKYSSNNLLHCVMVCCLEKCSKFTTSASQVSLNRLQAWNLPVLWGSSPKTKHLCYFLWCSPVRCLRSHWNKCILDASCMKFVPFQNSFKQ